VETKTRNAKNSRRAKKFHGSDDGGKSGLACRKPHSITKSLLSNKKRRKSFVSLRRDDSPVGRRLDALSRPTLAADPRAEPSVQSREPHCSRRLSSPYHTSPPSRCRTGCHSGCWRSAHSRRMGWECQTARIKFAIKTLLIDLYGVFVIVTQARSTTNEPFHGHWCCSLSSQQFQDQHKQRNDKKYIDEQRTLIKLSSSCVFGHKRKQPDTACRKPKTFHNKVLFCGVEVRFV
jgi:hypothetical protein